MSLDPSVERHLAASEPAYLATVCAPDYRAFHNGLRILLNLECYELLDAGVIDEEAEYRRFADDPFRFFIRLGDRRSAALWTLIRARQPENLQPAPAFPAAA